MEEAGLEHWSRAMKLKTALFPPKRKVKLTMLMCQLKVSV